MLFISWLTFCISFPFLIFLNWFSLLASISWSIFLGVFSNGAPYTPKPNSA